MSRPIPQPDSERGEDTVLALLKRIEHTATCGELSREGYKNALLITRDLARSAIAQIEAMPTLDGQRSYSLWISEKRREREAQCTTAD